MGGGCGGGVTKDSSFSSSSFCSRGGDGVSLGVGGMTILLVLLLSSRFESNAF